MSHMYIFFKARIEGQATGQSFISVNEYVNNSMDNYVLYLIAESRALYEHAPKNFGMIFLPYSKRLLNRNCHILIMNF